MSDCFQCPTDTYSSLFGRTSRADCFACPDDSTTNGRDGNANKSSCICKSGFYQDNGSDSCLPCPLPGSNCSKAGSTLSTLRAAPGYFRSSNSSLEFIKCLVPSDCPGGLVHEQCRSGHTGMLCAVCEKNFVRRDGVCSTCDTSNAAVGFLSLSAGAIFLIMGFLLYTFSRNVDSVVAGENPNIVKSWVEGYACDSLSGKVTHLAGDNAGDIVENVGAPESLFTRMRILIGYTQICASLDLAFEIPWPPEFLEVVGGLKLINLSFLDILSPFNPCALRAPFLTAGAVHMLILPLCACLIIVARSIALFMLNRWPCCKRNRYTGKDVSSRAKKTMLFLIFLLYPVSFLCSVHLNFCA